MSTPTLTEFLLARLSEDEAGALAAVSAGSPRWMAMPEGYDEGRVEVMKPDSYDEVFAYTVCFPEGSPSVQQAQHIARHDPARVLAQVKAMRAIVEAFPQGPESIDVWDEAGWVILTALATPFADHPDYDPAWRLDT